MIEIIAETGSTNEDLVERLRSGETLDEGYWLMAERQTGGRGRMGRVWDSPRGNLFCSTAINLRADDPSAATLSFVVGLALFDTIERCLLPDTPMLLKWPNDLMVYDAKIAGILLERHGETVIAGIGVNVSHSPDIPDRKTIHIGYANGKFANGPDSVLDILADALARRVKDWRDKPLAETLLAWSSRSHRYNDHLRVSGADGQIVHGSYRGITLDGAMRLLPIGEREMTFHAGDVMLGWHDEEEQ